MMAGAKRTGTKPGMGAVRPSSPPKGEKITRRQAPITVPSLKMPRVEDVSSRPPDSRGTLKRTPSGDNHERSRVIKTPTSHVVGRSVPVLTPNAGTRKDIKIEPADAFLLSRIDGQLDAQELADLTGLSERDVIASLKRLVKAGLVKIAIA